MKNREKLAQMSNQEIAEILCDEHDNGCSGCIGYKMCVFGGGRANGVRNWLESEAEEDNDTDTSNR